MTRDLGAHPMPLSRLLDGVGSGTVVLPEFQRTFDWSDNNVRSLLATVLMSWPAGSLLLMHGDPEFALRPLEGAPPRSSAIEYVILDGQQRLTSLFHAFRGSGDDVWVLNLSALPRDTTSVTVDDLEESITSVPRAEWDEHFSLREQAVSQRVPLHSLQSPADYFEWRDSVTEEAPADTRKALRKRLTDLYKDLLSRVHEYSFPAVVLQAQLPVEAIARIFERINRTGLRLTTFDLMVARTYKPGWNLRDEWREAKLELPVLDDFLDDGLEALQLISLAESRDIRQPAVLQTDPDLVRARFDWACQSLAQGYEWLIANCGVRTADWVPYGVMPLVVGGLAGEDQLGARQDELVEWFWLSVLSQRFDVASSTQATSDYASLLAGDELNFSLQEGKFKIASGPLIEATRRKAGAFWRGFACGLGAQELRDPLSGKDLIDDETGLLEPRTSIASVFPRHQPVAGRSPYHLRVLGMFVGSRESVRNLQGQPHAWQDDTASKEAFESQFIPTQQLDLAAADPEAFMYERLSLFRDFVDELTSVAIEII